MKHVILSTFAAADTRINAISDAIYKSGRWTDGITRYLTQAKEHPTNGMGAFAVVPGYEPWYSAAELNNAVELTEDWKPIIKNPII